MGPESHSVMLPKGMAGSGERMTQKWQRKLGGRGRVGAGRLAGKLLLCMASENILFFPMRYEIVQKTAVLTKCEIS